MTYKEKIVKHYREEDQLAREYLEALRYLLKQYENKQYHDFCPLCQIKMLCCDCPWWVLVEKDCTAKLQYRGLGRVPQRKAQLKRWIKSYEAAVKELFNEKKEA